MAKQIEMSETLTPAEKIALDKVKADKASIAVGDHNVDFIVRIKGTVRKGADYEQTPSHKIPTMQALALFIKRMGFQRDKALAILVESMRAAMNGEAAVEIDEAVADAEKMLRASLAQLPPQTMSGKVTTVDMVVEKVELTADVAAVRV